MTQVWVREKAIEMMEKYNMVPKDPMRRAILARLVDLAPAALGVEQVVRTLEALVAPVVKAGPIDLVEYRSALQSYQSGILGDGYDWAMAATDILRRIQILHNKVLYAGAEQIEMVKLLCGFHIMVGDIASEQRLQNGIESFNKAIILAHDYKLPQQYAYALHRRGVFFKDIGNLEASRRDYQKARGVKNIPQQLKGTILSLAARADASCAQEEDDVTEALDISDEARQFIGNTIEGGPYFIKFDEDRWLLSRIAVRVGSPLEKCRFPDEALKELEKVTFPGDSRLSVAREIEGTILQAKMQIDKGKYEFATQLASDAAAMMREIKSYSPLRDLARTLMTIFAIALTSS